LRKKILGIIAIILMIAMLCTQCSRFDLRFAYAAGPSINLPPAGTVNANYVYPGSNSYWDITLSNVPSGYDVTNGVYTGWCNDETHYINNGETLNGVTLYSSYDPSNPYPSSNWAKVNYIINHKLGSATEVQDAIWHYIDGGLAPSTPNEVAMVNAADTSGGSFIPVVGQLLTVVVWDTGYQTTFIEVTVPTVQLTVTSAYGTPTPTSGPYTPGASIVASVTSPVAGSAGTQYVCTGWTGTGDVPVSGTGTTVTFTISQDSSITWNWKTQCYLTVKTDPPGVAAIGGEGWYDLSSIVTLTAPTAGGYTFKYWDIDGVSQGNGVNPVTVSMDPPHVATAHYVAVPAPVLWVDGNATYNGPCLKSSTFNVDVRLWNDIAYTNSDVYAWDFTLNWTASPYITLDSVMFSSPWATGNYYIIDNSFSNTSTSVGIHDAMTAVGQGTGLQVVNNFTLVTLAFHVNADILYGEPAVPITFTLNAVSMSGDGTVPTILTPEIDNGLVTLQSGVEPEIGLSSPGMLYDNATTDPTSNIKGDYYVTANANGVTHTFTIYVTNASDVYGFYVDLTWNSAYKSGDVQQVTIDPNFPPPYEYISTVVGSGSAQVTVVRPCEKAPVCGANVNLFSIVLTEKVATGGLPTPFNSTVSISSAFILSKDPITGQVYQYNYPYPGTTFTADPAISVWSIQPLSYLGNMGNVWAPKSADLTYDGKVDINDLAVLAKASGLASPYTGLTAVGFNGVVNIYDFVFVAKHFGDP